MAQTSTTVRVQSTTRDLINKLAEATGLSVDGVIREALAAMEWKMLRAQAAEDARRLRDDPREAGPRREVMADLGLVG